MGSIARELVLITGATGHLGFRVLVLALQAGYQVRAAVHTPAKADAILSTRSVKSLGPGYKLSFVLVSDIIADGAYDEAVKGVKYIIHVASPIRSGIQDDFENKLIKPAVKGTTSILASAYQTSGITRIVITSSVMAVVPISEIGAESGKTFDGQLKVPINHEMKYGFKVEAYADSTVRTLAATHEFVATKKPEFDIINLMPSYIIGKNELVTDANEYSKGSNRVVFNQVLGIEAPAPLPGSTVFLHDIASLHVCALNPKIPGNQDFPANSGDMEASNLGDAIDIVARNFLEAVVNGTLPNNGTQLSKKFRYDVSKTEKTFGMKFASFEVQVKDLVQGDLDLVAAH